MCACFFVTTISPTDGVGRGNTTEGVGEDVEEGVAQLPGPSTEQ
jgi:hypothetical protein